MAISFERFGEIIEYELIEDGKNIKVSLNNKDEFIELYLKWLFEDSISTQFSSFIKGFFKVVSQDTIQVIKTANYSYLMSMNQKELYVEKKMSILRNLRIL